MVFLDAFVLKIREKGSVARKACYLALGIAMDGERDVLGMWFQETEGAKFWMQILSELKQRGVQDILICCVDGLKGFPEAIEAIVRSTVVQTFVVHLIRESLRYVPRRDAAQVARDLKPIYTATDADAAQALEVFDEKWGARLPVITQAVAEQLGIRDPVSGISARSASSGLHDRIRMRSKPSTGSSERRSRPRGISPTRRPPASSYTSRSPTPCRRGPEPGTGRQRCWRSRSTSETAYPTETAHTVNGTPSRRRATDQCHGHGRGRPRARVCFVREIARLIPVDPA